VILLANLELSVIKYLKNQIFALKMYALEQVIKLYENGKSRHVCQIKKKCC